MSNEGFCLKMYYSFILEFIKQILEMTVSAIIVCTKCHQVSQLA